MQNSKQLYILKGKRLKTKKNKYMKNKNFRKLKYVPGSPQNAGFCTESPVIVKIHGS
jgi:hypothetical protein